MKPTTVCSRQSFNTENSPIFRSKDAPHYILRLFSDWIVSLPASLLGLRNYDYLIDQLKVSSSWSPGLLRTLLGAAIEQLTELESHTLAAFCSLCEQVTQNHPINQCTIQHVAAHFGRNVLWTRHPQTHEPMHIEDDFPAIELVVSALIRDWRQIFNPAVAGLYPLGLRFEKFVPEMSIGFTFRYALVASVQQTRIHSLSKVMSRSQLYLAVLLDSEIRLLRTQSHLFESRINLREAWLGSPPEMSMEAASSRCIGLWEIGMTPLSTALEVQSTWVIVFDSNASVFALPTTTGLKIRPIGFPGSFSCGILTPVGLLLGRFDGSVALLDLESFQWKNIFDPTQSGVEPGPVVLLSPHIGDTNAVWVFFLMEDSV